MAVSRLRRLADGGYYSSMPTLRKLLEKINIRAQVAWEEPLSSHTTFHIGGPAEALIKPEDEESLLELLRAARAEAIPLFVLGGGANLLVGDKGIRGIVLDTSLLHSVRLEPGAAPLLVAGAGLSVDELCLEALCRSLSGVENFAGMPGTVGGAAYMNARCYEVEMSQVLASVRYADAGGEVSRCDARPGDWSYKRSPFQPGGPRSGAIILEVAFRLTRADPAAIAAVMRARRADREAKGHYRLPSAGSVFKNDRRFGAPTGKLLDSLGLRGRRIGGAMVSEWHANIFVNSGGATAADMRDLIELAQAEAREKLSVDLDPEVLMVGEF